MFSRSAQPVIAGVYWRRGKYPCYQNTMAQWEGFECVDRAIGSFWGVERIERKKMICIRPALICAAMEFHIMPHTATRGWDTVWLTRFRGLALFPQSLCGTYVYMLDYCVLCLFTCILLHVLFCMLTHFYWLHMEHILLTINNANTCEPTITTMHTGLVQQSLCMNKDPPPSPHRLVCITYLMSPWKKPCWKKWHFIAKFHLLFNTMILGFPWHLLKLILKVYSLNKVCRFLKLKF